MGDNTFKNVRSHFGPNLQENFPLHTITTVQTGGNAKGLVRVKNEKELLDAIEFLKSENVRFLVVGGLSNLLFQDSGYDGLVVKNEVVGIEENIGAVVAQSGTILQDLVDFTIERGLWGLHKMTGIPGTVGGAIYGNAGAYGQTISDFITSVTVSHEGKKLQLVKSDCKFAYRQSVFKTTLDLILNTKFNLAQFDSKSLQEESKAVLAQRLQKYHPGLRSPGSFFMNVPVDKIPASGLALIPADKIRNGRAHVGWILESVGSKGYKVGGVEVADYHGNLFIHKENGTSADYLKLSQELAKRVKEKYGIVLEPEVQIIC